MEHAPRVRRLERRDDLPRDRHGTPRVQRAVQPNAVAKRRAVDPPHRDVAAAGALAKVIDTQHVRVSEIARKEDLLAEPVERFAVHRVEGQNAIERSQSFICLSAVECSLPF